MTWSEAKGDLFDPTTYANPALPPVDAIGHGVNCFGVMGAGIAVGFKKKFPEMYEKYRMLCQEGLLLPGQVMPWKPDNAPMVYNIASQYKPGPDAQIHFLNIGLLYVRFHMWEHNLKHLALPWIGAGIGGLDYNDDVLYVVNEVFGPGEADLDPPHVTMVEWSK